MKPDWKDAPEWANWLAMDDDSEWWWFELEPTYNKQYSVWAEPYGMVKEAALSISGEESLEARP